MDMISGIAQTSMELSEAKVATAAQVSVMKNVMDTQKDVMAILLEGFGIGRNTNVQG